MEYVHTLVFLCPECKCPVAITRISDEATPEVIDQESIAFTCSYCHKSSEVLAVEAKQHSVINWRYRNK